MEIWRCCINTVVVSQVNNFPPTFFLCIAHSSSEEVQVANRNFPYVKVTLAETWNNICQYTSIYLVLVFLLIEALWKHKFGTLAQREEVLCPCGFSHPQKVKPWNSYWILEAVAYLGGAKHCVLHGALHFVPTTLNGSKGERDPLHDAVRLPANLSADGIASPLAVPPHPALSFHNTQTSYDFQDVIIWFIRKANPPQTQQLAVSFLGKTTFIFLQLLRFMRPKYYHNLCMVPQYGLVRWTFLLNNHKLCFSGACCVYLDAPLMLWIGPVADRN